MKEWFIKIYNILWIARHWIFFGVILSFLPPGLVWLFKYITGCDITIPEIIPDSLLLSFAVAVNALGCSVEYQGSGVKRKGWGEAVSLLFMLFCAVFYFGLYMSSKGDTIDLISVFASSKSKPNLLLFLIFISFLSNIIVGIVIKWAEYMDNQNGSKP